MSRLWIRSSTLAGILLVLAPGAASAEWIDTDADRISTTPPTGESAESPDGVQELYDGGYVPPDLRYGCTNNSDCPTTEQFHCRTLTVGQHQREALIRVDYNGACSDQGRCEVTDVAYEELCWVADACYVAVADEGPETGECLPVGYAHRGERIACASDDDCLGPPVSPQGGRPPLEVRTCHDSTHVRTRSYDFCIESRGLCRMQSSRVDACVAPLTCAENEGDGHAGCVFTFEDVQIPEVISPPAYEDLEGVAQLRLTIAPIGSDMVFVHAMADDLDALGAGPFRVRVRAGYMFLANGDPGDAGQQTYSLGAVVGGSFSGHDSALLVPDENGTAQARFVYSILPMDYSDCSLARPVAVSGTYLVDLEGAITDDDGGEDLILAQHVQSYVDLEAAEDEDDEEEDEEKLLDACDEEGSGCTDPAAENFDPNAEIDDGSCTYSTGCTDPVAENFDPSAYEDDGSCAYPSGCTDSWAMKYDPEAYEDDGSCVYPTGCTDGMASNYDPEAYEDDGSCVYPTGCTDYYASNHDPQAYVDDGSCTYVPGCTDSMALNHNPDAYLDDGSCTYGGDWGEY